MAKKSKYYVIETSFNSNKNWEQIGGKYPLMHKALAHMMELDLTFPTRIVRVCRDVVWTESYEQRRRKKANGKRVAKNKKK